MIAAIPSHVVLCVLDVTETSNDLSNVCKSFDPFQLLDDLPRQTLITAVFPPFGRFAKLVQDLVVIPRNHKLLSPTCPWPTMDLDLLTSQDLSWDGHNWLSTRNGTQVQNVARGGSCEITRFLRLLTSCLVGTANHTKQCTKLKRTANPKAEPLFMRST